MKNRETDRKKFLLNTFILSGILSAIAFAVDGICAFTAGSMPISIPSYGGDCTGYLGIGWKILTVYSCSPSDSAATSTSTVYFSPDIFIFWGLIWIVLLLARAIVNKIKNRSGQ